jgi:Lon protease-like protein
MSDELRIPDALPILPIKKGMVYPSSFGTLEIETDAALCLIDHVMLGDRMLVAVAQNDTEREPTKLDDLFHVGTLVRLPPMVRKPEGKFEINVLGLERVMIGELTQEQPYFIARIALKPDLEEAQDETKAMLPKMIPSFRRLVALSQKMPAHVVCPHLDTKDLSEAVYMMAFFAGMDIEHAQHFLELDRVSARIQRLSSYVTIELEQFEQLRKAAYIRSHDQSKSQSDALEVALAAFNAADTWEETRSVLEVQQPELLSEGSLDTLRSYIARLREQKASRHWIFRLENDQGFLEDTYQHGIESAWQHIEQRTSMLQNQEEVYEALKRFAMLSTPEDFLNLIAQQQADSFSPTTFNALHTLFERVTRQDPAQRELLELTLTTLEQSSKDGADAALKGLKEKFEPQFKAKYDLAMQALKEYMTSRSLEEAYQTLKEHQEVLLSDLVHRQLEHLVAQLYKAGDLRDAEKLETHLNVLEDARVRGVDAAWQAFVEDVQSEE